MDGIRVLEVADFVFVPAAAGVLADWGAQVTKVEHHVYGDLQRTQAKLRPKSPVPRRAFNPLTESTNRGKRSIGINLADPEGLDILYRLVRESDVFLTSKLESSRQKLRIDVEHIREQNPQIIYARGSGYGVRGPECNSGAFDATAFWYRSGMAMGVTLGEGERVPALPAGATGDLISSMNLVCGVSAALFHRERTGEATTIDVSLLGSAMWALSGGVSMAQAYEAPQRQPDPDDPKNPFMCNYRTLDGRWIAIYMPGGFSYWRDLCRVLDIPDFAEDARFATEEGIQSHAEEIVRTLSEHFAKHPQSEWIERLMSFRGQWAPIRDVLSVQSDQQVVANGLVSPAVSSTGEDLVTVQAPVQYDEAVVPPKVAPGFDVGSDEILEELGFAADQVQQWRASGVLASGRGA
jgi:crotonobetainyl-CoA:carnitine CoA-transferase CaiB-like acyl-CoA transferase